jgi:hypothetical protein
MKKIVVRTLRTILTVLLSLIGLFLLLVLFFNVIRWNDIALQRQHLAGLEREYRDFYVPIDEQAFVSFDLSDNELRLNEIRMIASHNSYKKLGSPLGKLFVGLGDSWKEAEALEYDNPDLSFQLNSGIRSFELDVRYRAGDFEAVHVPLVDNSSTAVKLALAFTEIALWSEHNPNHIPIILLMEIKYDWMMLDPFLTNIGLPELQMLDQLIVDTFGETLYTPLELRGSYASMQERLSTESWPLVSDLLGKVIVVMHPGRMTVDYAAADPDFNQMAMFPAVQNLDVDHPYAAFVVHNNPNPEAIASLLAQNLIVRTRMDEYLSADPDIFQQAMLTGAQIMTTDFHSAHRFINQPYYTFDGGYLIVTNTIFLDDEE